MKDKGHFYISLTKSVIRIGGCLLTGFTNNIGYIVTFFIVAEFLGILEELVDSR